MAITVASVLSRAATQLNDAGNVRWTQAELLDYLNEGQRLAAVLKPDFFTVTADVVLVVGTRQSVPADGFMLQEVQCNVDETGAELSAVRVCTRAALDSLNPDWRMAKYATTTGEIKNYVFEGREPKTFYVQPPVGTNATSRVRLVYAKTPVAVLATDNISVPDLLDSALVDYILFRAFFKDTEADGMAELSNAAYARFANALGVKEQVERRDDPNQGMTGFNPANPASNK